MTYKQTDRPCPKCGELLLLTIGGGFIPIPFVVCPREGCEFCAPVVFLN